MRRKAKAKPHSCPCASVGGWDVREYQFPPGTVEAFELHHPLDGPWERIHRCPTCAQLWLQSVTGGHATIVVFEKIDAKEAATRIAQEEEAAPLRQAQHEARLAQLDRDLEAMGRPHAIKSPMLEWAGIASFGIGTIIVFPAMMMGEGPEQMRLVFVGGGLFLIGMGCAAWAALRQR